MKEVGKSCGDEGIGEGLGVSSLFCASLEIWSLSGGSTKITTVFNSDSENDSGTEPIKKIIERVTEKKHRKVGLYFKSDHYYFFIDSCSMDKLVAVGST